MNFILCVITFLSVMIWSHPGAVVQEADKTPVGEVVAIGCQKSWRIDENGKQTLLHRKKDKGRKIFEGESYRCEGKGVLKLIVRSRPVDVTQKMGPHPIGRNAGEDKKNTAGSSGDDLTWLEGSFQLNKAESDKAARATEKFLASLTTEQRAKLTTTFGMQLISPKSFTVIPESETVKVLLPQFDVLTLSADGKIHEQQLPDGTGLKFSVKAEDDRLFLSTFGHSFKADMRVEPKDDGKKLAVTRTILVKGQAEPVSWTAVYDRTPVGAVTFYNWYGFEGLKAGSPVLETATAELQQNITTEGLTQSNFSLRVDSPVRLAGGIITGRISKTVLDPATGTFRLNVDFDSIRLPDGSTKGFRAEVGQILSQAGGVIAKELDLLRRRVVNDDRMPDAQAKASGSHHQATYTLDRPLVLDKGSKIQLYFLVP